MPTHIGLLRAVNIGRRQYRTADLRAALEGAGYADVETYIQTGNVRITTPLRSRAKVEAELEALFLADRGFEVRTIVLSPVELSQVAADAAELAERHVPAYGHYVSMLKTEPASPEELEAMSRPGERLVVRGRAVHLLYDRAYHEAKVSNAQVERLLGVATNRNAKVIRELARRWGR